PLPTLLPSWPQLLPSPSSSPPPAATATSVTPSSLPQQSPIPLVAANHTPPLPPPLSPLPPLLHHCPLSNLLDPFSLLPHPSVIAVPPRPLLHSLATTALFLLFPATCRAIPLYSSRCPCLLPLSSSSSIAASTTSTIDTAPSPTFPHLLPLLLPLLQPIRHRQPYPAPPATSPLVVAILPRLRTATTTAAHAVATLPYRSPHCCRPLLLPPQWSVQPHLSSSTITAAAPLYSARCS
ncbi:hypothetical protein BHE74_00042300, partial [Ensete ventricosum]